MPSCSDGRGISPVIGVILMVAITVVLAAVITVFVTGIGDSLQENSSAGVVVEETPNGVQVQVRSMSQAEVLRVLVNGQKVDGATLTDVGQYVTVTAPEDATVTVVGETKSGNKSAISSITTSKDTTGGAAPKVVSTNIFNVSEPHSSAPSDLSAVLNDMKGSGTSSDPYIITNDHELQAMNADLDAHYKLGQNIDASKTGQWNGGSGFKPIGSSGGFEGTLKGNGYTINSLTIDRPNQSDVGLFSVVWYSGNTTVHNIVLNNVDITGDSGVGGVAGYMSAGTLSDSSVSGSIQSSGRDVGGAIGHAADSPNPPTITNVSSSASVSGPINVGGVVGKLAVDASGLSSSADVTTTDRAAGGVIGAATNSATLSDSSASGTVNGGRKIGGIAGELRDSSNIQNSYSAVEVTGAGLAGGLAGYSTGTVSNSYAIGSVDGDGDTGGLVGWNNGSISNSYATGSVAGTEDVGGLVGYADAGSSISKSYSAGSVSGSTNVGGAVGSDDSGGNMSSLYWDTEASGQTNSAGGGTGLTTSEMQGSSAETNMTAFDWTSTWATRSNDYPTLQD